jgi:hypothetical protein
MILPLSGINPDTSYPLPNLYPYGSYGFGYGRKLVLRQEAAAAPRGEVRDIVSLSPAARRLIDQAERLASINPTTKE